MAESPATLDRAPVLVPIRSLGPGHRERIADHLLALDEHDRYLRFGYAASDEQVRRYADSLDFDRDDIFGIYNRRLELIAMAHLAFVQAEGDPTPGAEFGVSVLKKARGRGYGARPWASSCRSTAASTAGSRTGRTHARCWCSSTTRPEG